MNNDNSKSGKQLDKNVDLTVQSKVEQHEEENERPEW